MTAKIKILQYVIFIEPRKFDTANIKCFTVLAVQALKFMWFEDHWTHQTVQIQVYPVSIPS